MENSTPKKKRKRIEKKPTLAYKWSDSKAPKKEEQKQSNENGYEKLDHQAS